MNEEKIKELEDRIKKLEQKDRDAQRNHLHPECNGLLSDRFICQLEERLEANHARSLRCRKQANL